MGLNNQEIAPLISKYLRKDISEEEMFVLQAWLDVSDEHKRLLSSLERDGYAKEEVEFLENIDVNEAWQSVKDKKTGKPKTFLWKRWVASVAALALLAVGLKIWKNAPQISVETSPIVFKGEDILPGSKKAELTLSDGTTLDLTKPFQQVKERDGTEIRDNHGALDYSNHVSTHKEVLFNTLKIPKTGMYQLTLPDGTKAWVNAMSTLKFPVQFVGQKRIVYLEGEAYFEVAKDSNKPFVVDVNGSQIHVLGTQFNVNSYTSTTTTTLVEGAVRVVHAETSKVLKPGQEASIENDKINIGLANIDKVMAWKVGDFYFERDNIKEIMQQLQRWYDFEISYQGKIPDILFSGNITRSSKLSEVLEMLNFVSDNTTGFEVHDKHVRVLFHAK